MEYSGSKKREKDTKEARGSNKGEDRGRGEKEREGYLNVRRGKEERSQLSSGEDI